MMCLFPLPQHWPIRIESVRCLSVQTPKRVSPLIDQKIPVYSLPSMEVVARV